MTETSQPDKAAEPQRKSVSDRQTAEWDIRNAPGNYLSMVLAQAGSAFFSFTAIWLITGYLGPEGYGGIVAFIAASQVAQVLVNWTSGAVVRFGIDEFIEMHTIARTFWVRGIILLVNFVPVLLLSGFWYPPLAGWLKLPPNSFWIVALHFGISASWVHVIMSLQGAKMPRVAGFLQMIERLIILAGLLILLTIDKFDFFWVFACYIAAPAAMVVIGLVQIRRYILVRFSIDRQFVATIIKFSVPLAPMALVGYFSGAYLDAIFLSNLLSVKSLGIYSLATQVNGIVLQLPTLANTLINTLFITLEKEGQTERVHRFFKDLLPSIVLLGGLACIVMALWFTFLIPLVFGVEFADSVPPLWILLGSVALVLPVLIGYAAMATAKSATSVLMIASMVAAAANTLFNILLIPPFGLLGCAWATAASFFAASMTYSFLLKKRFKIELSWTYLAMFPSFGAAVTYTQTGNALLSFLICVAFAGLIGFFKYPSIKAAADLMNNLRIRSAGEQYLTKA